MQHGGRCCFGPNHCMLETRHQGSHSSESEGETSATTEGDLHVNKRANSQNATNELYFQILGFTNLGDVLYLALPASEWIQINKDVHPDTGRWMFTAAERRKPPSAHQKTDVVHPHTAHHLAFGRTEGRIHSTTWTNLENTMLSERNQTQKAT